MSVANQIADIQAQRAARRAALEQEAKAVKALRSAYAYPRCGDGFPKSAAEKKAAEVLSVLYGSIENALVELDVFS